MTMIKFDYKLNYKQLDFTKQDMTIEMGEFTQIQKKYLKQGELVQNLTQMILDNLIKTPDIVAIQNKIYDMYCDYKLNNDFESKSYCFCI